MKQMIKGALSIAAAMMLLGSAFAADGGKEGKNGVKAGADGGKTVKTKTVLVDDARLVYRTYGDKGGLPLVLLAPLGSSMDDWDPAVINGLAKNATVIVFDNKGVGS